MHSSLVDSAQTQLQLCDIMTSVWDIGKHF